MAGQKNWWEDDEIIGEAPQGASNWWDDDEVVVAAPDREMGMILPFSKGAEGDVSFDSDAGLLGAFKRSFMLPGDVMAGKVDPGSEEGIGRAFEFATTFSPAQTRFPASRALAETPTMNPINRAIVGESDDAAKVAARTQDFRDIGVQPTTGMVSGSARAAAKEQALATTRHGRVIQDRIDDVFAKQSDEFGRIVDGIVTRNSPGAKTNTRQELGDMLREQAQAAKDAAFTRSEALYDDVGRLTGDRVADGSATRDYLRTLSEAKKAMGKSESLNKGAQIDDAIRQANAIVADVEKGMTFTKMKEARTAIGALANSRDLDPALKSYLDGLRKALTTDMEQTARVAGDDALQAFRKANNQYRRTVDTETGFGKNSIADKLVTQKTPEQVFEFAMGKSREGGSRLAAVRRQIEKAPDGKATWDNLTGSVVERMGLKNTDDIASYDPGTFLKNWKQMSPEAKNALFRGTDRAQYRQDLDRLARVADDFGKYQKLKNHSNTQTHKTLLEEANPLDKSTMLGAVLAGPKGAAVALGGKAVNAATKSYQARLLANPETVNWIAGIPKAPVEKGGLRQHWQKLRNISNNTSDAALRTAIHEYMRAAGYEAQNQ